MRIPHSLRNPGSGMLRQFAAGWALFFFILGARGWWHGQVTREILFGAVALAGPLLCWIAPAVFRKIFLIWMWLAFPVGWLVSQISLGVIFYGVVTPLGFFLRLTGRDRLMKARRANVSSYWKRQESPASVHRYFRPY